MCPWDDIFTEQLGGDIFIEQQHYFVDTFDHNGLMSYAASRYDFPRDVAAYVDKVLKGAKPADLPVAEPTRIELVINLKAAKAIGLTIPQSLLLRADKVIPP
jgi:putative ABC transport system substrate-binding protein